MKIARLLMVLLALGVTALSAGTTLPTRGPRTPKGGIEIQNDLNKAGGYYYCYDDYIIKDCYDYWDCMISCEIDCGGPCDEETR